VEIATVILYNCSVVEAMLAAVEEVMRIMALVFVTRHRIWDAERMASRHPAPSESRPDFPEIRPVRPEN